MLQLRVISLREWQKNRLILNPGSIIVKVVLLLSYLKWKHCLVFFYTKIWMGQKITCYITEEENWLLIKIQLEKLKLMLSSKLPLHCAAMYGVYCRHWWTLGLLLFGQPHSTLYRAHIVHWSFAQIFLSPTITNILGFKIHCYMRMKHGNSAMVWHARFSLVRHRGFIWKKY